jgi:hypothetical protein
MSHGRFHRSIPLLEEGSGQYRLIDCPKKSRRFEKPAIARTLGL